MKAKREKIVPLAPRECIEALRAALAFASGRKASAVHPIFWPVARADAGVKKVVKRSHLGWVTECNTRRLGSLETQSSLERDFLVRADADLKWQAMVRQPFAVAWRDGRGKLRYHIPDFGAVRLGRLTVVEVKPEAKATSSLIAERTEVLKRSLAVFNVDYRVETELWIRAQPALVNAHLLKGGRCYWPTVDEINAVRDLLGNSPVGLSPHEICSALGKPLEFVYSLYAMTLDGVLAMADETALLEHGALLTLAGRR